jgi:hypothetical protein
VEKELLVV